MSNRLFAALKQSFPNYGAIEWIGLRHSNNKFIREVHSAELLAGHGLVGDKAALVKGSRRQVTLLQAEYLPVISSFLNQGCLEVAKLRRNIVISGINLGILKGHLLQINNAIIEITGSCAPCKKMELVLGAGGFNAMQCVTMVV